jgi:hypothetical protein
MGGTIIDPPDHFELPDGGWYVCVIQNGPFDAAAVAFDKREFDEITDQHDHRPKTWLIVPDEVVYAQLPNLERYKEQAA